MNFYGKNGSLFLQVNFQEKLHDLAMSIRHINFISDCYVLMATCSTAITPIKNVYFLRYLRLATHTQGNIDYRIDTARKYGN